MDCDPSATPFPAGALFASETTLRAENPGPAGWIIPGESHPGRLLSFVETKAGHLAHSVPAWRTVRVNSIPQPHTEFYVEFVICVFVESRIGAPANLQRSNLFNIRLAATDCLSLRIGCYLNVHLLHILNNFIHDASSDIKGYL